MAAGSIYGTQLVTKAADSPHLTAKKARAELYFGCAEHDAYAPMETIDALKKQLKADDVKAEIEIYPGVHHGFAFPQRAAYDKPAAEQHWERLLSLYKRRLTK